MLCYANTYVESCLNGNFNQALGCKSGSYLSSGVPIKNDPLISYNISN